MSFIKSTFTAAAFILCIQGPISTALAKSDGASGYSKEDHLPVDPADWERLLKRTVIVDGPASRVDYAALKNDHGDLDRYLNAVQSVTREQFAPLSEKQKIAFLVNAYNALTIQLILDHYPVKSIRDIGGFFSNPWKQKFFKLFWESHSLDDIEQEILRKQFSEPRIHFALVCASKGCPALRPEPYLASKLDEQFEGAARTFLRDPAKNRFDLLKQTLFLSSIFKWYGDDFVKRYGSVKAFIAPRMVDGNESSGRILESRVAVQFLDYDWSLNGK